MKVLTVEGRWIATGCVSDDSRVIEDKDAFKAERIEQRQQWGPCAGLPYNEERAKGRMWLFSDGERWTPEKI